MSPDDPRHGTTPGYHAGCRNICCRRALAKYEKRRRLASLSGGLAVDATGTQRRIFALMALGWTSVDIANEAGWPHRNRVLRIVNGQKGKPTTWVERKTAEVIASTYKRMSMSTPELTPMRRRTKIRAERLGYAPPLAWDDIDNPDEQPNLGGQDDQIDPVVVDRLLAGKRVESTRAEKVEAMRRWLANGGSERVFCQLHGWREGRYSEREEGAA